MKRDFSKDYYTLTPHERFQLAIKAMARTDDAEAERLNRTCPKHTYKMNDIAFANRLEALERLAAGFLMGTEQINGKLIIHETARKLTNGLLDQAEDTINFAYDRGFSDSGGKGGSAKAAQEMTDEQIQELRDIADRCLNSIHRAIMSHAKAVFEAFEAVCRQGLGLDVETVIASLGLDEVLTWLDREELEIAEPAECPGLTDMFIASWDRDLEGIAE